MAPSPSFPFIGSIFAGALLFAWPVHAQPQGSDQFSTSGDYGRFEVGNAHRWYDDHSTNAKQNSAHCLSILDEAKAIEETALALDEQARRPGNSRQATALRKQANAQFGFRDKKVRAFINCFNHATRQQPPVSDTFSTKGNDTPSDQIHTQPSPRPASTSKPNRGTDTTGLPDNLKPQGSEDVFITESSNSNEGSPTEKSTRPQRGPLRDSIEDSDCLPKIDPHVIEALNVERNELLRDLGGGGYITHLTLTALRKLLVAHMHHLTEPNEGLLSKTTRKLGRVIERAPQTAVTAGQVIAEYMTNDTAANHRYLYGQVEAAVKKVDAELKTRLRNPHITIAEIADSFLVGRATGSVCPNWTLVQVEKLKKKTDRAKEASTRVRDIHNMPSPGSNACAPKREDCFWRTLHNATGDPSYQLRKELPTWDEVHTKLKQHFGGANAKDPLTGRRGDLQKIAEGIPVPVIPDEFAKVINRLPNNSEGMTFIVREDGSSHVFSFAKFAGSYLFWDDQVRSSNMDILFAGAKTMRWFRYK